MLNYKTEVAEVKKILICCDNESSFFFSSGRDGRWKERSGFRQLLNLEFMQAYSTKHNVLSMSIINLRMKRAAQDKKMKTNENYVYLPATQKIKYVGAIAF